MPDFLRLDHIEDYAERAKDNAPWRFFDDKRFHAFLGGLSDAAQCLEDHLFNTLISTTLDAADGVWLDQWGDLLNIGRDNFPDKEYRRFLKAGILIRLSQGTPDELATIFKLLTAPSEVKWWRHDPRGFRIDAFRAEFMSDARVRKINRLMERVRNVTMNLTLVEVITPPELSGTGQEIARTL